MQDYSYETSNQRVQLSSDARQAVVDTDVTERLSLNDHQIQTQSHETSVVESRDGKLALIKVVGTVSGRLK